MPPVVLVDCTKRYYVQRARPLDIVDYGIQGEAALFAADIQSLTINLLLVRFQDHAQGTTH